MFTVHKIQISHYYLLCNLRCILECNLINCIRLTDWEWFCGLFFCLFFNFSEPIPIWNCMTFLKWAVDVTLFFTWQQPTKPFRQLIRKSLVKSNQKILCSVPLNSNDWLLFGFGHTAVLAFSNIIFQGHSHNWHTLFTQHSPTDCTKTVLRSLNFFCLFSQ